MGQQRLLEGAIAPVQGDVLCSKVVDYWTG